MDEAQVSLSLFTWVVGGLLGLLQLIGLGVSSWVIGRVIDLGKEVVAMTGEIKGVAAREAERAWIHAKVSDLDKDHSVLVNKVETVEQTAERIERAVHASSEKIEKTLEAYADKFERRLTEVGAISLELARAKASEKHT